MLSIPVINLEPAINQGITSSGAREEAVKLAGALKQYGLAYLRDPRVQLKDAAAARELMTRYYRQPIDVIMGDARPNLHYVGVTPRGIEKARNHAAVFADVSSKNRPATQWESMPPDPKLRYMIPVGSPPIQNNWPDVYPAHAPVVPQAFVHEWQTMTRWGDMMLDTAMTYASMISVGLGLSSDTFTQLLTGGPHILAPTGAYLDSTTHPGEVQAAVHYDLNFSTLHPQASHPGLYAWTRDMKKFAVTVPDGCLLVQAGKELWWLTGGVIHYGYHEVVVPDNVRDIVKDDSAAGRIPVRVALPFFVHVGLDNILQPYKLKGHPYPPDISKRFRTCRAGDYLLKELQAIGL